MADIAVIGAGPVGQVVAATLRASGTSVALCEINDATRSMIARDGIAIRGVRDVAVGPFDSGSLFGSIEELGAANPRIVMVCVKAVANPLVASALAEVVSERTLVISWQNGIDTERPLAQALGRHRVARAVVNFGVNVDASRGGVTLAFEHVPHYLRELDVEGRSLVESAVDALSSAGLLTERAEHLTPMVWRKAILNAGLNALCGLTGLDMAAAARDSSAWGLAENILVESIQVARANEIWVGTEFYGWARDYLGNAGAHRPSMLADLDAGRRTEIDYINGQIAAYGRIARVATPYNDTMVALVKARESQARPV